MITVCNAAHFISLAKTLFQEGACTFQGRKIGFLAYTRFQTGFNKLTRSVTSRFVFETNTNAKLQELKITNSKHQSFRANAKGYP